MECYRLKHKQSGLYFCPVKQVAVPKEEQRRGIGNYYVWTKTNLSKNGKVYTNKPSFHYLGDEVCVNTKS